MYEYNLALRFQRIAEEHAGQMALWFGPDEAIDYAGLNNIANRLAHFLLDQGISRGDVVCLSGAKSLYTYASILACLKVGAIYSVFDLDSPPERLWKIFSTCRPRLIMAEQELLGKLDALIDEIGMSPVNKEPGELGALLAGYDAENLELLKKK